MPSRAYFLDHAAFHRQVARVTLAGAAVGLTAHLVPLPQWMPLLSSLALAVGTALLGLAAFPPQPGKRLLTAVVAGGVGLLAALCHGALASSSPAYPRLAAAFLGAGVGVLASRDLRDHRRWGVPAALALTMPMGLWVEQVLASALPLSHYVPAAGAAALQGAAFGLVLASGLVVRQICFDRDRVAHRFEQLKPLLGAETAELVQRAIETHGHVREALREREDVGKPADGALVKRVEGVVLDLMALAERWQGVEREANRTSAEGLTQRLEQITARIAATSDEVARRQYEQARAALAAQLGYLRDISRTRERVLARIQNHLAALERLHLAVLNHRGADAAKLFDEVVPMLDAIEEMGQEMDFASEAMSEVAEAGAKAAEA